MERTPLGTVGVDNLNEKPIKLRAEQYWDSDRLLLFA
jgi:hypothetical protein